MMTKAKELRNIIFLDIDGVFNCQLHYQSEQFLAYRNRDHSKDSSNKKEDRLEYDKSQICEQRIKWFNELVEETNALVVISSTWRSRGVQDLQEMFDYCSGTFKILDVTPHSNHRVRGVEIKEWLSKNCMELFGIHDFDFYRYAIIDDDSDMLLRQQDHFFQTDNYSGLTPNTCYKIKRFFTHKTF